VVAGLPPAGGTKVVIDEVVMVWADAGEVHQSLLPLVRVPDAWVDGVGAEVGTASAGAVTFQSFLPSGALDREDKREEIDTAGRIGTSCTEARVVGLADRIAKPSWPSLRVVLARPKLARVKPPTFPS
jgi:hypothetical protein